MITFIKDDNGATAIEYGMIVGFMAVLIGFAWAGAYGNVASAFDVINTAISVAIKPAIMPYSIAVAPLSSLMNVVIIFLLYKHPPMGVT